MLVKPKISITMFLLCLVVLHGCDNREEQYNTCVDSLDVWKKSNPAALASYCSCAVSGSNELRSSEPESELLDSKVSAMISQCAVRHFGLRR